MSNDYYERQSQMDPGGLADGLAIEQEFDSISRAFGKLPKPHRDGGGFEGPTKVGDPEKDDDAVNKRTLAEAVDAIKGAGGDAVLDVRWLTTRSPMRTGYAAGDGQTLSRSLYPDALAAIQAGLVPVCTDAEWLADPAKRGYFTLGDGSSTFRVPDYNGKSAGALGAAFMRGDGLNSAGVAGRIQGDAIRNIKGVSTPSGFSIIGEMSANDPTSPVQVVRRGGTANYGPTVASADWGNAIDFDASRAVPTAADNHPVSVTGCWAVKLFGAVQNSGSADAAALATAVAELASRTSVLEQRKSTCLVNAVGTGAPHETVVAQLPANIVKNTRYVLPNPFGINTPVECWAEVFVNGRWACTGWAYTTGGYGTNASYVQGEGIVVQTGTFQVVSISASTGGGHGWAADAAGAHCRVFVRKLEA